MKKFLIIFFICLFIWTVLVLITANDHQRSAEYNEVGLPFVFHREFSVKTNSEDLSRGFIYSGAVIDIAIVTALSVILNSLIKKGKR